MYISCVVRWSLLVEYFCKRLLKRFNNSALKGMFWEEGQLSSSLCHSVPVLLWCFKGKEQDLLFLTAEVFTKPGNMGLSMGTIWDLLHLLKKGSCLARCRSRSKCLKVWRLVCTMKRSYVTLNNSSKKLMPPI